MDSLKILDLLKDEQVGLLTRAIYHYQLNGTLPANLDHVILLVIQPFINQFERDNVKYNGIVERNTINGKKGGRGEKSTLQVVLPKEPSGLIGNPKKASANFGKRKEPKQADSDSDSVSVSVSVSDSVSVNDSVSDSVSDNDNDNESELIKKINAQSLISSHSKQPILKENQTGWLNEFEQEWINCYKELKGTAPTTFQKEDISMVAEKLRIKLTETGQISTNESLVGTFTWFIKEAHNFEKKGDRLGWIGTHFTIKNINNQFDQIYAKSKSNNDQSKLANEKLAYYMQDFRDRYPKRDSNDAEESNF
jgi:hypothetical protein